MYVTVDEASRMRVRILSAAEAAGHRRRLPHATAVVEDLDSGALFGLVPGAAGQAARQATEAGVWAAEQAGGSAGAGEATLMAMILPSLTAAMGELPRALTQTTQLHGALADANDADNDDDGVRMLRSELARDRYAIAKGLTDLIREAARLRTLLGDDR